MFSTYSEAGGVGEGGEEYFSNEEKLKNVFLLKTLCCQNSKLI